MKKEKYFVYSIRIENNHKNKYINKDLVKEPIIEIVVKREHLEKDMLVILTETYKEDWGIKRITYLKTITERFRKEKKEKNILELMVMYLL